MEESFKLLPDRLTAEQAKSLAGIPYLSVDASLAFALSQHTPGTNTSFLENKRFLTWLSGDKSDDWKITGQEGVVQGISRLWLYGEIGSGRSVLAAQAVKAALGVAGKRDAVAYFSCGGTEIERTYLESILRTLACQIARQSQTAFVRLHEGRTVPHWADVLRSLTLDFDRIFVIVDDADVLPAHELRYLMSVVGADGSPYRLLVTTRDGPGQREECRDSVSCPIRVRGQRDDIRRFIQSEIKRQGGDMDQGKLKVAEESIVSRSHGAWLWAVSELYNHLDMLRHGQWVPTSARIDTSPETEEVYGPDPSKPFLTNFPFEDMVLRTLQSTDALAKTVLIKTLHWVCVADAFPEVTWSASEAAQMLDALLRDEGILTGDKTLSEDRLMQIVQPMAMSFRNRLVYGHSEVHNYLVAHLTNASSPLDQLLFERKNYVSSFDDFYKAAKLLAKTDLVLAEAIYKRIWQARETSWGADDKDTTAAMGVLADFYLDQARYADAEALYLRALATYEATNNKELAAAMCNNLGIAYKNQSNFAKAEEMYTRSLAIRRELYPSTHKLVLDGISNLGYLYAAQGRHQEARDRWAKVAPHREDVERIHLEYNIAMTYKLSGDFPAASTRLKKALTSYEEIKGADHPDTIEVVDSLAEVSLNQERYKRALDLFKRVLEHRLKEETPDRGKIFDVRLSIARVQYEDGQYIEAYHVLQVLRDDYESYLGWEDVDMLEVLFLQFLVLEEKGDHLSAIDLGYRVFPYLERVAGPHARMTLFTADHLGLLYAEQDNLTAAHPMWTKAYDGFLATRGNKYRLTCAVAANLGALHKKMGNKKDALKYLRAALEGYRGDKKMEERLTKDVEEATRL